MIDGAVVVLAVPLDSSKHRKTRATQLFADGAEQVWFQGLAIARYGRDTNHGDNYLFYCDAEWETLNDSCYSDIEEALSEGTKQFSVQRSEWLPVAWPFDQTQNTACISTVPVMRQGHPILLVQHFEDDHSWVFGCGTTNSTANALVISMEEAFGHDPSIAMISDLKPGWTAERADPLSPWVRRRSHE